nr:zinc knuckle CX2CX4HX4C [Tanacetum cinerariifolium]
LGVIEVRACFLLAFGWYLEGLMWDASLSDESINPGLFDCNVNLKPSKSILKKGKSPIKEGRKVSMNASTMVWEVVTDYASPIKPVFNSDASYLPNASDNEPDQVAKEIRKVSNDGESGVSINPNPSPNVNANAIEFEKDVMTTVNTTNDQVLNSFASVLKHKVNRVAEIMELRNDKCVKGAAVMIPLAAIEEVTSRFENTLYGYFVGKHLAYQMVENYVKNVCAYARAFIEISADDVLKEDLVIAISVGKDKGHSLAFIRIEYEWMPPRCST